MSQKTETRPVEPMKPERLFASAGLSINRLPLLRTILDQFRAILASHLGDLTTAHVVAALEDIEPVRSGEALLGDGPGQVTAYFEATAWKSLIALKFDRPLIVAMIEAAFGGERAEVEEADDRPFTRLEMRLAAAVADRAIQALGDAFEPIVNPGFRFVRLERRRNSAGLGPEAALAIVSRYRVDSLHRSGQLRVIIPQGALLPLRTKLARAPTMIMHAGDPLWASKISREINRTEVKLKAVLDERQMTLGELSALGVGDVLHLQATPQSQVRVSSRGQTLFWCALGQTDGVFTLRVEDSIGTEADLASAISEG